MKAKEFFLICKRSVILVWLATIFYVSDIRSIPYDHLASHSVCEGKSSAWKLYLGDFFSDHPSNRYLFSNIKRNWSTIRKIVEGQITESPAFAEILVSPSCNLRCPHCRGGNRRNVIIKYRKEQIISPEGLKGIVKELIGTGVKYIRYSGDVGDPLCITAIEKTQECINYVMSYSPHVKQGLVTNGIGINESIANSLIHLNDINVSFDVTNAQDYNDYKGTDKFDKVIANLTMLISKKKKSNGTVKIKVSFLFGSYPIVFEKLEKIVDVFANMGVDQIIFKFEFGNKEQLFTVGPESFRYFYDNLEYIKEKLESAEKTPTEVVIVDSYEHAFSNLQNGIKPQYSKCYFSLFQSTISPSGMLIPCCHTEINPKLAPIANLKVDSFPDIWKNVNDWKGKINPKEDCEFCFRVADRFNGFMDMMVKLSEQEGFLDWFEENYIHDEFELKTGLARRKVRRIWLPVPGGRGSSVEWFAHKVEDFDSSS